jgi:hypothetical protein
LFVGLRECLRLINDKSLRICHGRIMRGMGHFLDDRWAGGMTAVLTAAFVLMQLLFSAWACASTLTAGTTMVICHGTEIVTITAQHNKDDRSSAADHGCPCGTLCGVGVAVLVPVFDGAPAYAWNNAVDLDFAGDAAHHLTLRFTGAPRFPTGPPVFSA